MGRPNQTITLHIDHRMVIYVCVIGMFLGLLSVPQVDAAFYHDLQKNPRVGCWMLYEKRIAASVLCLHAKRSTLSLNTD